MSLAHCGIFYHVIRDDEVVIAMEIVRGLHLEEGRADYHGDNDHQVMIDIIKGLAIDEDSDGYEVKGKVR